MELSCPAAHMKTSRDGAVSEEDDRCLRELRQLVGVVRTTIPWLREDKGGWDTRTTSREGLKRRQHLSV